jgi:hypothetical protein
MYAKTTATSAPVPILPSHTVKGVWNGTNCLLAGMGGGVVNVGPNLQEVRIAGSAKLGNVQQRLALGYTHIDC